MSHWRLKTSVGTLSAATAGLGLAQSWVVLAGLGAGTNSDVYFASATIPQLVVALSTSSLIHVLVPLFAHDDGPPLPSTAWSVSLVLSGAFAVTAVVLGVAAPLWIPLTNPGFSQSSVQEAVTLVRIQLLGMTCSATAAVAIAVCQVRERYVWVETVAVITGALALGVLVASITRYGVAAAAWTTTGRSALTLALLVPALGRWPAQGIRWAALRTLWQRLRPLLAGSVYFKTDLLVDRALASFAPPGHLSLLAFASALYSTGGQIVSKAIVTPAVVVLARHAGRGDWQQFDGVYARDLRSALLVSFAGFILVVILGAWVLLWGLPGFAQPGSESARVLLYLLVALGGYFVAGCAGQVVSGGFYATGDTVWPTRVGAIGFTLGVILKVLGFYAFGVVGVAMGTSTYYVGNALALHAIGKRTARRRLAGAALGTQ